MSILKRVLSVGLLVMVAVVFAPFSVADAESAGAATKTLAVSSASSAPGSAPAAASSGAARAAQNSSSSGIVIGVGASSAATFAPSSDSINVNVEHATMHNWKKVLDHAIHRGVICELDREGAKEVLGDGHPIRGDRVHFGDHSHMAVKLARDYTTLRAIYRYLDNHDLDDDCVVVRKGNWFYGVYTG